MNLVEFCKSRFSLFALWSGLLSVSVGIAAGFFAGTNPLYLALAIGAIGVISCLFINPETTILGLLVLRSMLDPFSAQQLPTAFALGLDSLTVLYVVVMLSLGKKIHTDGFWYFFCGWVVLQGLWLVLLPLGGLGMDGAQFPDSLKEWIRLCSWVMAYLLVMQLKATTPPQKVIAYMFWSLLVPLSVAALQVVAPSVLPPMLSGTSEAGIASIGEVSRINGTIGLANTFATFCLLFLVVTWWQLGQAKQRLPWLVLLCVLMFFIVSTKSLFILVMVTISILVLIAPRLSAISVIGGVALIAVTIGIFASSDFGRERLASLYNTPLLDPDMDVSRSILLSATDNNSFNWRIAQWTYLLQAWQQYPILGYGLLTCPKLTVLHNYAHNEYVRAITEQGIVGLALFMSFLAGQAGRLIYLIRSARTGSAQRDFCWTLLAMLVATIVGMLTENIWTHTTLFYYWWTFLAIAGWNWDRSPQLEQITVPQSMENL